MRSRHLVQLFVLSFGIVFLAYTNTLAQTGNAQELFVGGLSLRLGLPKTYVLEKLRENNVIIVDKENPDYYHIFQKRLDEKLGDNIGSVMFKNNQLDFASKKWMEKTAPSSYEVIDILHTLLERTGDGINRAKFATRSIKEPGYTYQIIEVFVGNRRISILSSKGKMFDQDASGITITESIGAKNEPR